MQIGRRAQVTRTYDVAAARDFAGLAGFEEEPPRAVPEPLIAALFSYLLGVKLPGPGTNYLKQELAFLAPAPLNEPLTATVEVTRLRPDKHLVDLATVCTLENGTEVCRGRALVLFNRDG